MIITRMRLDNELSLLIAWDKLRNYLNKHSDEVIRVASGPDLNVGIEN